MKAIPTVAISGDRLGISKESVFASLEGVVPPVCLVIQGGSKGVDQYVKEWCALKSIPCLTYAPYFVVDKTAEFNPRMFFMANKQMVEQCDLAIAFSNDADTKTKDFIRRAEKAGKDLVVLSKSVSVEESNQ